MSEEAKQAAIEVLKHNIRGPYGGLPRTAGWGYPEPYTRDWMIAALGVLVSGDEELIDGLRRMLETLAQTQTPLGNIASLANDPSDCGASDTTPLFLIALSLFRSATGEQGYLAEAAERALEWTRYQSPDDTVMVAQQPTSDWRDEQWVWGYGLYVNALTYACLRLFGIDERARRLRELFNYAGLREVRQGIRLHEGLALPDKPYYAFWVYKVHRNERLDLLGNSLAILFGAAERSRAKGIIEWVEQSCQQMRANGELACELPPCFFPFTNPGDEDWHPRYGLYNMPGDYHNGGIWPFVAGFYVAALAACGLHEMAARKMDALTELVRVARDKSLAYGFNEWFHAQDCTPRGQDWQTWSAAMYLYAAACVERKEVPFFGKWLETEAAPQQPL